MALVQVISSNIFAGANLQKLEVGTKVEVSDDVAERWQVAGLAKVIDEYEHQSNSSTSEEVTSEEVMPEITAKSKKAK